MAPRDEEGVGRFSRAVACQRTPTLLMARAAGELSRTELESLHAHLYSCADCRAVEWRFNEAERAYAALAGDDAPALGRPLVAELIRQREPETGERRAETGDRGTAETGDRRPETGSVPPL